MTASQPDGLTNVPPAERIGWLHRHVRVWRERLPRWVAALRRRPGAFAAGTGALALIVAALVAWVMLGEKVLPPSAVPAQKMEIINSTVPPPLLPQDLKPVTQEDARALNAKVPLVTLHPVAAKPFRFIGTPDDLARAVDCLAAAAWYEAGDDAKGQKAVIQTIINRSRHPAFPASICGAVFQGSERSTGCQFTFTCDGALAATDHRPPPGAWKRAQDLAKAALSGTVDETVGYATHYHADYVIPYWADSLDKIAVIGPHIFYRWPGFWGTPPAFRQAVSGGEPVEVELAALSPAHAGIAPGATPSPGETPSQAALAPDAPPLHPGAIPKLESSALRGNTVRDATEDGSTIFLKLDPQSFPGSFAMTSLSLCKGKRACRVLGWKEDAGLGRALPLSQDSIRALSFAYIKDMRRGVEKTYWNCAQYSRSDTSQCLPAEPTARWRIIDPE